jgi:transcription elongation factor Elf1
MLLELKTFLAICDNCGYEQEFTASTKKYPPYWGSATRKEYVKTRMEDEQSFLCPHCVESVKNGFKKYNNSTLRVF